MGGLRQLSNKLKCIAAREQRDTNRAQRPRQVWTDKGWKKVSR